MTAGAEALETLARRLLPPGIAVAVLPISAAPAPLLPTEAACVAKAIPRRQHEFALGRTVLRLAIARAGIDLPITQPITARADRAPDLPRDFGASLSHSRDYCIALASRNPNLAPGVDVESLTRTAPEGLPRVVQPYRSGARVDAYDGLLPFSAKEAIYKSQRPHTGKMLGFGDAAMVILPGRFRARFGCGYWLCGGWGLAAGHLLTLSWRSGETALPAFRLSD